MSKLITYAYFMQETDISETVEHSKLDNPIKNAGDRLKALIGKRFYDELVSQVITTPKSLTTDNDTFFDPYVKQYLAWQAYEFYLVKANTFERRTGIRVFKEDDSDPVSDKIMGEQIAISKEQTQFYKDTMINFLRTSQRNDSTKYPLYTNSTCNIVGSRFGISAVSKIDTVNISIDRTIINQEP